MTGFFKPCTNAEKKELFFDHYKKYPVTEFETNIGILKNMIKNLPENDENFDNSFDKITFGHIVYLLSTRAIRSSQKLYPVEWDTVAKECLPRDETLSNDESFKQTILNIGTKIFKKEYPFDLQVLKAWKNNDALPLKIFLCDRLTRNKLLSCEAYEKMHTASTENSSSPLVDDVSIPLCTIL